MAESILRSVLFTFESLSLVLKSWSKLHGSRSTLIGQHLGKFLMCQFNKLAHFASQNTFYTDWSVVWHLKIYQLSTIVNLLNLNTLQVFRGAFWYVWYKVDYFKASCVVSKIFHKCWKKSKIILVPLTGDKIGLKTNVAQKCKKYRLLPSK